MAAGRGAAGIGFASAAAAIGSTPAQAAAGRPRGSTAIGSAGGAARRRRSLRPACAGRARSSTTGAGGPAAGAAQAVRQAGVWKAEPRWEEVDAVRSLGLNCAAREAGGAVRAVSNTLGFPLPGSVREV